MYFCLFIGFLSTLNNGSQSGKMGQGSSCAIPACSTLGRYRYISSLRGDMTIAFLKSGMKELSMPRLRQKRYVDYFCPSHVYPANRFAHHLTSPPPAIALIPSSRQIEPSASTAATISIASPSVMPSSCATCVTVFEPSRARKPESRAENEAWVYSGVCSTLSPEANIRARIGGSVNKGSCVSTSRSVEGGIRADRIRIDL